MSIIYIIDHSNFSYKFKSVYKYAQKEVAGLNIDISVLVGYIKALKSNMFNDIIIVLDGVPMNSLRLLPSYKGQRVHERNDSVSVPKLEVIQFLTKIGPLIGKNIKVVCAPGQEADQVMASLTYIALGKVPARAKFISRMNSVALEDDRALCLLVGHSEMSEFNLPHVDSVILGTTDSDLTMLCRHKGVFVDISTSGKNIRDISPKATKGLPFAALPLYKAIFGDISDNVPGLKLNKQDITKIMQWLQGINTDELLTESLQSASYTSYVPTSQLSSFLRNLEVVNLKFYSFPMEISFPSYDVMTTIEKYGLRV